MNSINSSVASNDQSAVISQRHRRDAEELIESLQEQRVEMENQLVYARTGWILAITALIFLGSFAATKLRLWSDFASDSGAWFLVAIIAATYLVLQAFAYYKLARRTTHQIQEASDKLRSNKL